jgi:hypothetical protein
MNIHYSQSELELEFDKGYYNRVVIQPLEGRDLITIDFKRTYGVFTTLYTRTYDWAGEYGLYNERYLVLHRRRSGVWPLVIDLMSPKVGHYHYTYDLKWFYKKFYKRPLRRNKINPNFEWVDDLYSKVEFKR